jgi:hypothetical protein
MIALLRTAADEYLDTYVSWREECDRVHAAYERWNRSPREDRGAAFAVYRAALERDNRAAAVHSDSAAQLEERARRMSVT